MSVYPIIGDVNFDHLVSARFLHCEVTPPLSPTPNFSYCSLWKEVKMCGMLRSISLKAQCLHNLLKLFSVGDLSILSVIHFFLPIT